jgi:hypothetical protein
VPNLRFNQFGLGWYPDADAENAPAGALLRADNLVLDEIGALSVRRGSSKLDDELAGGAAHTVRSMYIEDTLNRFAGVGDKLYKNGVDSGFTFAGSGDIAIGTDAYQAFFARGSTKKKYDGTSWNNWPIAAPGLAPTLTAANATTATVATFNSAESPAFTVTEGTSAFVTSAAGSANGALELTASSVGQASAYKKWASDQDFLNISGTIGGDTDIYDMYVALSNWDKVDTVTVMFGLGTGTDPFLDDYYWFDWELRDKGTVDIKSAPASLPGVLESDAMSVASAIAPEDITQFKTADEIVAIKNRLGKYSGPKSRERRDAVQSSPAWFHYSTTRAQFSRTGGTAGRDWTTVRGFKVVVHTTAGGSYTATFDTGQWYAGGSRALTGKFRCLYVPARDTGAYVELGPPSPISDEITLNQNGLNVAIPAAAISSLDTQVNQLWVYLFSINLGGWYRFAITGSTQSGGMSMDEFDPSPDSSIDANDRTRFTQWGLTIPGFSGSADLALAIRKSEDEALREGVRLVPYLTGPPDNIVAIAGPYASRMFALTSEGWLYISAQNSPSHFNSLHIQDLRRYGDPKWMVRTNGGIFVGMTQDIIHIGGTGDEDENANVDFFPEPLGVGNPPVDAAFFTDGNAIVYRAADGLMTLVGASVTPVTQDGVSLLWRGQARHGVEALNIETGRFRLAVDNHILYMLAPEGTATDGTSAIWRYDTTKQRWCRTIYASSFYSIHRDPDGRLIAGDSTGNVWLLEDGSQDDGSDIAIDLRTPIVDSGQPLMRKTAHDLVVAANTGGSTVTVSPMLDGSGTASASWTAATSGDEEHRQDVYGLADFTRLQLRLTGSFFKFILRALTLSYRSHPQQRMSVDSGYLTPPGNGDIGWIREVEVRVRSGSDLELVPIFDDVAMDAIDIAVTANKYTTYRVTLARGQNKGRMPRILLRTTASADNDNVGFECEWMRIRWKGTGNVTEKNFESNAAAV